MEIPGRIGFFDLPQEIRDMVHAYLPHQALMILTQSPSKLKQPATAHVNRRMREEALPIFYSRSNFSLDLRG